MLVISGVEEAREGETWVPLFEAYPYGPLLDDKGAQAYAKLEDLTEFETDREVRIMVQPVLTALELKSADPAKRRAAAATLGEAGDTARHRLLAGRPRQGEGPRAPITCIEEALGRLELRSGDPARRKAAAIALGDAHAGNALPELKALVTPGRQAPSRRPTKASARRSSAPWTASKPGTPIPASCRTYSPASAWAPSSSSWPWAWPSSSG